MGGLDRGMVYVAGLLAMFGLAGCSGLPALGTTASTTDVGGATSASGFLSPTSALSMAADEPLPVIEHPAKADLALAGPLGDRSLGKADAPLTIYEYASLTCPYCKAFHLGVFDQVKKNYIDTGKVRWVLREFPIGHTSGAAWIVNRCAPEKDYFKLYDTFIRNQAEWVSLEVRPDAIAAVAAKAGLNRQDFDACWNSAETDKGLRWVKSRARQLGVSGTPTFFIGLTKVRAAPKYEDFAAMIDAELQAPGASLQVAMARNLIPKVATP